LSVILGLIFDLDDSPGKTNFFTAGTSASLFGFRRLENFFSFSALFGGTILRWYFFAAKFDLGLGAR
jgi:hypothetical protein